MPFFIILCLAGLKAIDAEQYDAASVDGAGTWRRFLHVTLPGMRYVIIVAVLLNTIFTFNSFTLTYLLTRRRPAARPGSTRSWRTSTPWRVLRYGSGIAVAMTTAPFLFLLILFLGRYMMQRSDAGTSEESEDRLAHGDDDPLWLRMVVRGLLSVFWTVNNAAESVFELQREQCGRPARRRCCHGRPAKVLASACSTC